MNEQLPEVSALLSDASKEGALPERPDYGQGLGRQYVEVVGKLREKNFSFPQIAEWFEQRGVHLTVAGWRSAWKTHQLEQEARNER